MNSNDFCQLKIMNNGTNWMLYAFRCLSVRRIESRSIEILENDFYFEVACSFYLREQSNSSMEKWRKLSTQKLLYSSFESLVAHLFYVQYLEKVENFESVFYHFIVFKEVFVDEMQWWNYFFQFFSHQRESAENSFYRLLCKDQLVRIAILNHLPIPRSDKSGEKKKRLVPTIVAQLFNCRKRLYDNVRKQQRMHSGVEQPVMVDFSSDISILHELIKSKDLQLLDSIVRSDIFFLTQKTIRQMIQCSEVELLHFNLLQNCHLNQFLESKSDDSKYLLLSEVACYLDTTTLNTFGSLDWSSDFAWFWRGIETVMFSFGKNYEQILKDLFAFKNDLAIDPLLVLGMRILSLIHNIRREPPNMRGLTEYKVDAIWAIIWYMMLSRIPFQLVGAEFESMLYPCVMNSFSRYVHSFMTYQYSDDDMFGFQILKSCLEDIRLSLSKPNIPVPYNDFRKRIIMNHYESLKVMKWVANRFDTEHFNHYLQLCDAYITNDQQRLRLLLVSEDQLVIKFCVTTERMIREGFDLTEKKPFMNQTEIEDCKRALESRVGIVNQNYALQQRLYQLIEQLSELELYNLSFISSVTIIQSVVRRSFHRFEPQPSNTGAKTPRKIIIRPKHKREKSDTSFDRLTKEKLEMIEKANKQKEALLKVTFSVIKLKYMKKRFERNRCAKMDETCKMNSKVRAFKVWKRALRLLHLKKLIVQLQLCLEKNLKLLSLQALRSHVTQKRTEREMVSQIQQRSDMTCKKLHFHMWLNAFQTTPEICTVRIQSQIRSFFEHNKYLAVRHYMSIHAMLEEEEEEEAEEEEEEIKDFEEYEEREHNFAENRYEVSNSDDDNRHFDDTFSDDMIMANVTPIKIEMNDTNTSDIRMNDTLTKVLSETTNHINHVVNAYSQARLFQLQKLFKKWKRSIHQKYNLTDMQCIVFEWRKSLDKKSASNKNEIKYRQLPASLSATLNDVHRPSFSFLIEGYRVKVFALDELESVDVKQLQRNYRSVNVARRNSSPPKTPILSKIRRSGTQRATRKTATMASTTSFNSSSSSARLRSLLDSSADSCGMYSDSTIIPSDPHVFYELTLKFRRVKKKATTEHTITLRHCRGSYNLASIIKFCFHYLRKV